MLDPKNSLQENPGASDIKAILEAKWGIQTQTETSYWALECFLNHCKDYLVHI